MIKIISFAGISKFYEEFETMSWISLMLNHHKANGMFLWKLKGGTVF